MHRLLNLKNLIGLIFVLLFIGAIAGGYYYYTSYQKLLKNPDIVTQQEVNWLEEKVGKLMELPDETPTTATVLDKDKLKDQPFFQKAENGDKILIYTAAKKAILYRPSTNKIVEVMPIAIDNTQNGSATTQNVNVVILNGSTTSGLADSTETDLKGKIANVTVVSKGNAKKSDYASTVVVDLNGSKANEAKAIADAIGGSVGSLPDGEDKPADTDILIIVAK